MHKRKKGRDIAFIGDEDTLFNHAEDVHKTLTSRVFSPVPELCYSHN
jgi:hypothetical protein